MPRRIDSVTWSLNSGLWKATGAQPGLSWLRGKTVSQSRQGQLSEEGLERAIGENLALIGDIFTATLTPAIDAEELNQSTMRALAKKVSPELFDKFKATTFEALPEQMFIDDGDSHMPSEEDVAQLMTYIKSEVGDDAQLMLASAFLGAPGSALIAVKSDGSKALAISMHSSLGSFEE